MSQKSSFQSVVEGYCPQCRSEQMFVSKPFQKKFLEMKKRCPHCDLQFEREPGCFYGAMYVSYALSVALFLAVGTVVYVLGKDPDLWVYIVTVVIASLATYPINFRLSRSIFLHLFAGMQFDPKKVK